MLDMPLPAESLPGARHDQLFAYVRETFVQQMNLNNIPSTIDICEWEDCFV